MPNSGPCDIGMVAVLRPWMYPNGAMPTSSTPLDVASNTSNGGTIAPPGNASTLRRPPDIFSTDSAQSLKIRCRLAAAGCDDWPLRSNGAVAVCENTGAGETKKIPATAKASRIVMRLRISLLLPLAPFGFSVGAVFLYGHRRREVALNQLHCCAGCNLVAI